MKIKIQKLMSTRLLALGVVAALTLQNSPAANKWWQGGAGTANNTSANWHTSDVAGTATTLATTDKAIFSVGSPGAAFTISGTPTATGGLTVEDGTVTIGSTWGAFGAAPLQVNSGATLVISVSTSIPTSAGSVLTLNGGRMRNSNTATTGSFIDVDTTITLNGGGIISATGGSTAQVIIQPTSIISGTGPLTKDGNAILAVAAVCTYTGDTIVNDGQLRCRTTANVFPTATDLTVNAPGIFSLNNISQRVGSLTGSGNVTLGNATLTIGGSTSPAAFTGAITSTTSGDVTKTGTGTVTFSGNNTFNGTLTLSQGTITVTSSGFLCDPICDVLVNGGVLNLDNAAQSIENLGGTGGTINLTTGHVLEINPINGAASATYSGVIAGAGGITKIGAPTETLLGANTYTGPTTVNIGKLVTTPASTGAGSYTVADGATLGVKIATAGTTLNVSDFTIGNSTSSTMEFDFAALGYPTAKVINDAGTIAVDGTVAVNVKGFYTVGGPVTLLEHVGARSGGGSFTTGILPPRVTGAVTDDTANNRVTFNVTAADTLLWVSDANGVWDVNNGANAIWQLVTAATATDYQENAVQGDTVRFDDTATGTTTVNVSATISPFQVTVDNTLKDYSFGGVGKISSVGSVIKSGTGQLTITTTNDYTGGTTLNAGTVNVGNNTAFGTGKVTINSATPAVVIRSDGATARSLSMAMDLNGNATLSDSVNIGDLTFSGVIAGTGGLTKVGSGVLSLTGANTFNGGVSHTAGTLRVNSTTALGAANSPVTLANGVTLSTTANTARTLTYTWTINGDFTLGQAVGGTAAVTMAGTMDLGGAVRTITTVTNGTISAGISNGGLTKEGSATLTLSGTNNYNGLTTINAGTLSVTGTNSGSGGTTVNAGGILSFNANGKLASGTLTLAGGNVTETANRESNPIPCPVVMTGNTDFFATTAGVGYRWIVLSSDSITTSGGTLQVRNLSTASTGTNALRLSGGGFTFSQPIVIGVAGDNSVNPNSTAALALYGTNGAGDTTISGQISGYGFLLRGATTAGTGGRTILTGDNSYTGGTIINDGTLLVNNTTGSGTGSGTVTVNTGGVLGGTGTVGGAVVVKSGGTVTAGASPGTLTLANGLDLSAGGTNVWELSANSTSGAGTTFDQLSLTAGDLVLGGTSRVLVKFIGGATFPDSTNAFWQQTNTWKIIDLTGSAANPGLTVFADVAGAAGNNAGNFTTSADATGVYLTFTPGVQAPPPVIDPNIVGAGTTSAQLSWSSVAGATYKVQYKTNLNQVGWLDLTNLTATGTTTTIVDNTSPAPNERYYRVISP